MPHRTALCRVLALLAATPLLLLAGCLERIESITIRDDGSAVLSSEFRGDPGDFTKTDDALPEPGSAWTVSEHQEKTADGKDRVVRVAALNVPAGSPLPATYALAGDARADSGLRFPTTIRIVKAGASTGCEFIRTYPRRDEAKYAYHTKLITETPEFKKLAGADPSTLTDEQRATLLRGLARVEASKQVVFIEAGAAPLQADGTWAQSIGLALRQAALDYAEQFNIGPAVALLRQPQSEARDADLKRQADAFTEGLRQGVLAALGKLDVTDRQRDRFVEGAKKEMAMRGATEDLADERWEIRLAMPGVVTAHNADRVESGVLVWEFPAAAFLDREHVLRATSMVERAR